MVMNPRDMHPSQEEFSEREPDLVLTFDYFAFKRNQEILESLHRGDLVSFNATLSHFAQKRTYIKGYKHETA